MNKLIVLIVVIFISVDGKSQNTFPSSGAVGVGTNSPGVLFHVIGSGSNWTSVISNTSNNAIVYLAHGDGNGMYIDPGTNASATNYALRIRKSSTHLFNVSGAGYVGIGTESAVTPLHITGGRTMLGGWNAVATFQSDFPVQVFNSSNSKRGGIGYDYTSAMKFWVNASDTDIVATGISPLSLWNNGYVAVGADFNPSGPATPLHVIGGPVMSGGWNKTMTLESEYPALIFNSDSSKWGGIGYDHSSAMKIWVNGTSSNVAGTGTDALTISNIGNIGIGTASPSEKLSVEGNVSANGVIRSKKMTVTQLGWADYVFDDDYTLRSLDALEKYIGLNKHLPEVPSAKEVGEKGIDLGDTQALLLKKIEELTLYIIEMKKEIAALQSKRNTSVAKKN
jgi:hypothetical protein